MLGRLARWLRILGYDTLYDPGLDDLALFRIARAQERILLTQDQQLSRRRGIRVLLVRPSDPIEQLRQVLGDLGLRPEPEYSRCSVCNALLVEAAPEDVARHVPTFVRETQTGIRHCPQCGRFYWHGTHWNRMQQTLKRLGDAGENERGP